MSKKYFIADDVIAASGREGIQRLSDDGNEVFLDIEELKKKSNDPRNPHKPQYVDALSYINRGSFCNNDGEEMKIVLPNKGVVKPVSGDNDLKHLEDDTVVISKNQSTKFDAKNRGLELEIPEFLIYGADIFDRFIIDVNYNGDVKNMSVENALKSASVEEFQNNEILRVNGSLFCRVNVPLNKISDGRYQIDENSEPYFDWFDPNDRVPMEIDVKGRDLEQKIALHLLGRDDIDIYIIYGGSSSGKNRSKLCSSRK